MSPKNPALFVLFFCLNAVQKIPRKLFREAVFELKKTKKKTNVTCPICRFMDYFCHIFPPFMKSRTKNYSI